jgi:four helix bundle protein
MEQANNNNHFNDQLRERTMKMAVEVRNLLSAVRVPALDRPIANQLIRSSSSVAANYRSATRGRSDAEYFSKICIVVEEADETLFWLEYLDQINLLRKDKNLMLMDEVTQLVRIFSAIKRKMKEKTTGKEM